MQTKKMSLASIKEIMSRTEMKRIMAGSGAPETCNCNNAEGCPTDKKYCVSGCTPSEGKQGVCHASAA